MKNLRLKELVFCALLIALAIIIPTQFGFLKVYIPPFSATLFSHVPIFLSMFISPFAAVTVGIFSTVGFLASGVPIFIVARASMHIIVALIGCILLRKKIPFYLVAIITAPIHGLLEGLVLIPFGQFSVYALIVTVIVGTILHHFVDAFITGVLLNAISKATKKDMKKELANL